MRVHSRSSILGSVLGLASVLCATVVLAAETTRPPRVLLIAGPPDGHPVTTHEYVQGLRIVHDLLKRQGVETRQIIADDLWPDGPELLDGCDAAVLFRGEGAKWLSADLARLAAFQRLARRQGGLSVLHWGMGTRTAEPIAAFTAIFGGCHGGTDRKYQVLETTLRSPADRHPIAAGLMPFPIRDEFYYALKWPAENPVPQAVIQAEIDGGPQTVAWACTRGDGGRSFGFSGLHFHANWQRAEYRRLVIQGVLWSCGREIPADGLPSEQLALPELAPSLR